MGAANFKVCQEQGVTKMLEQQSDRPVSAACKSVKSNASERLFEQAREHEAAKSNASGSKRSQASGLPPRAQTASVKSQAERASVASKKEVTPVPAAPENAYGDAAS